MFFCTNTFRQAPSISARNVLLFFTTLLLGVSVLAQTKGKTNIDRDYIVPVLGNEIKIMSYNVHNLFNATHDPQKKDYEFLPLGHSMKKSCQQGAYYKSCIELDWTPEKVATKIETIKRAISAQGVLPDVLTLVEVENKQVVGQLARKLGFDGFVMTSSPDERGIDCAVLYKTEKLELIEYVERPIAGLNFATRNLSAAIFNISAKVGGGVLAVFPMHWPSQGRQTPNPRLVAAEETLDLANDLRQEYKGGSFHYVITGDFNTLASEKPNPIDDILLGNRSDVRDVRKLAEQMKHPLLNQMPPGTYYYSVDKAWNEFDRFFVSRNLTDGSGLEVDVSSYRIHAPSFVMTKDPKTGQMVPFKYNHKTMNKALLGYSDHFGVVMKLVMKK